MKKGQGGTVRLTSVGVLGKDRDWGRGMPAHTLGVTLGGIAGRPGVVHGLIEIREYLSVTVGLDHDIIDGAPAARFTQRFTDLLERLWPR